MSISIKKGEFPLATVRGSRTLSRDGVKYFVNKRDYDVGKSETAPSIKLTDGILSMIPSNKFRDTYYIFGKSGCGKSIFVGNYMAEYQYTFEDNPIYVVSRKSGDPAFEGVNYKHIDIDSFYDERTKKVSPLMTEDFPANSMVVFDDIDSIYPKVLMEGVQAMLKDLLNVARSKSISVIVTNHVGADYRNTRGILNEAANIVFYPEESNPDQIRYVLKKYGGVAQDQIQKIIDLPSRWVCLRAEAPKAVIYESGAYMLLPKAVKVTRKVTDLQDSSSEESSEESEEETRKRTKIVSRKKTK
jgi:hypothetical protein